MVARGGGSGRAIIKTDRITCGPFSFLRLLTKNDVIVYVTRSNERQQMTSDGARKMYAVHYISPELTQGDICKQTFIMYCCVLCVCCT